MKTEALIANLERTAVAVDIPAEHAVLLEISEPQVGIHHDTERLLHEIHHTYVGWSETLPELHRRAMNDVYLYSRHPRGPEGLAVYGDLYCKAATEAHPENLRAEAMRSWVAYLKKTVSIDPEGVGANSLAVARSLEQMAPIVAGSPILAAEASSRLKQLVILLGEADGLDAEVGQAAAVLRSALDQLYGLWLERDDPAEWFRALAGVGAAMPAAVSSISHTALRELRSRLGVLDQGDTAVPADITSFPDYSTITRAYLAAAEDLGGAVDARTTWLCSLLGEELLSPIHERALWSLARFCNTLVTHADRAQFERFIGDVFEALRSAGDSYGAAHLDLVRRIGVAVLGGARPNWVDMVIDEILTLDFHRPDFSGFTDDWSVRVNPDHLKNIRALLAIIGANPGAADRLLAALVIHLESGGVFIADTDLFQKDVSQLLAADIAPVYHQVRSLLRRLPVYFSDIGAEGVLRDVSTRIDEIRDRTDPICHFLRKQCHVESNPSLISLVEEIARFWATGDPTPLASFLPEEIHASLDIDASLYQGLHSIFGTLATAGAGLDALFAGPIEDVDRALGEFTDADLGDREKASLLFRLREELARKYNLDHSDLIGRLHDAMTLDREAIDALARDLDGRRYEAALGRLLPLLTGLRHTVLSTGATEIVEDIYRKRHIGTGIPSMYGSYREARLDALGLSFRIESLAGSLFDLLAAEQPFVRLDLRTLEQVARRLRLLARGLNVEGYRSQGLYAALSMLDDALALPAITREEIIDVFRAITHSVHGIVRNRVLEEYGDLFEMLGPRMLEHGEIDVADATDREAILRASEGFLRNLIAESMTLQRIDNLSSVVLHALNDAARPWEVAAAPAGRSLVDVVALGNTASGPSPLHLGNKGALLGRLADLGFPIPRGFIIPTGLARMRASGVIGDDTLPEAVIDQVIEGVATLERDSAFRFGDPGRPLLLSVRGGSPISMPGMLNSFLNVGINPDIVVGLAASRASPWAAWDAYRRFLQFWGMSHGLDRDLFDGLMSDAKDRFSAPKKAQLKSGQMAELANDYRSLLVDHGVDVADDPLEQLLGCIELVIGSWDSPMARVYRGEIGIADGWGTAVIIQNMVYGNLHERSGTGVLLTHNPQRDSSAFELFGDFVIQGQGDDVVSGLVDTFPISERQREDEPQDAGGSLEHDFPEIYGTLETLARSLVEGRGWTHQEIEFTFEGDRPEDLFILQTREAVADDPGEQPIFKSTSVLARSRLAVGIGVSGGALSCRVAQDAAEITKLRFEHPNDPVLLVRPDTVPDDIHLLLQADALLTAIGGATSHAAVVAKRLGKTCVVGCRELKVFEAEGRTEIAGQPVERGDWISISGVDGSVYLGRHEVEFGVAAGEAAARIGASE